MIRWLLIAVAAGPPIVFFIYSLVTFPWMGLAYLWFAAAGYVIVKERLL